MGFESHIFCDSPALKKEYYVKTYDASKYECTANTLGKDTSYYDPTCRAWYIK